MLYSIYEANIPVGDVWDIDTFISLVEAGALIDDDGYGCAAYPDKGVFDDDIKLYPSKIDTIPSGIPAVIWFNR